MSNCNNNSSIAIFVNKHIKYNDTSTDQPAISTWVNCFQFINKTCYTFKCVVFAQPDPEYGKHNDITRYMTDPILSMVSPVSFIICPRLSSSMSLVVMI